MSSVEVNSPTYSSSVYSTSGNEAIPPKKPALEPLTPRITEWAQHDPQLTPADFSPTLFELAEEISQMNPNWDNPYGAHRLSTDADLTETSAAAAMGETTGDDPSASPQGSASISDRGSRNMGRVKSMKGMIQFALPVISEEGTVSEQDRAKGYEKKATLTIQIPKIAARPDPTASARVRDVRAMEIENLPKQYQTPSQMSPAPADDPGEKPVATEPKASRNAMVYEQLPTTIFVAETTEAEPGKSAEPRCSLWCCYF